MLSVQIRRMIFQERRLMFQRGEIDYILGLMTNMLRKIYVLIKK